MEVKFVSKTVVDPDYAASLVETLKADPELAEDMRKALEAPEGLMAYIARVSSPKQVNPTYEKLLKYCVDHNHWSVFEMIDATFEITTSRAIAAQILRHWSFAFQEFSQRYGEVMHFEIYEARRQDLKNRQNSIDDLPQEDKDWFVAKQKEVWDFTYGIYQEALSRGIAKECSRFVLPLNTQSRLYMKGDLRSWSHYLKVRTDPEAQKEHRDIANAIKPLLAKKFPIMAGALGWK